MTAKKILEKAKNKDLKKILMLFCMIGLFGFIIIYALLNTRLVFNGIDLDVKNIEDGGVYQNAVIAINGNASRARHLLVNGREISINQMGEFSDTLILNPGYNIFTITAEDKFGKITKETFEVIREI